MNIHGESSEATRRHNAWVMRGNVEARPGAAETPAPNPGEAQSSEVLAARVAELEEALERIAAKGVPRTLADIAREALGSGPPGPVEGERARAIRDVVELLRSEEAFTEVAGRKPGIGQTVEECADFIEREFGAVPE